MRVTKGRGMEFDTVTGRLRVVVEVTTRYEVIVDNAPGELTSLGEALGGAVTDDNVWDAVTDWVDDEKVLAQLVERVAGGPLPTLGVQRRDFDVADKYID